MIVASASGLHGQSSAPALAGQDGSVAYLALDAVNQGGNTKNSLDSGEPPFDTCVEVAGGSSFTIDVVVDAIPTIPDTDDPNQVGSLYGVTALQVLLQYDSAQLSRGDIDGSQSLIALNAGSSPAPVATATEEGPPRVDLVGIVDITTDPATREDNMRGLGIRIPFTLNEGVSGFAEINLLPAFGPFQSKVTAGIGQEQKDMPIDNFPGGPHEGEFLSIVAAIDSPCTEAPPPLSPPEIVETAEAARIVAGATATAVAHEVATAVATDDQQGAPTDQQGTPAGPSAPPAATAEGTSQPAENGAGGVPAGTAESGDDGDGTSTTSIIAYSVAGVGAALAALAAAGWIIRRRRHP